MLIDLNFDRGYSVTSQSTQGLTAARVLVPDVREDSCADPQCFRAKVDARRQDDGEETDDGRPREGFPGALRQGPQAGE